VEQCANLKELQAAASAPRWAFHGDDELNFAKWTHGEMTIVAPEEGRLIPFAPWRLPLDADPEGDCAALADLDEQGADVRNQIPFNPARAQAIRAKANAIKAKMLPAVELFLIRKADGKMLSFGEPHTHFERWDWEHPDHDGSDEESDEDGKDYKYWTQDSSIDLETPHSHRYGELGVWLSSRIVNGDDGATAVSLEVEFYLQDHTGFETEYPTDYFDTAQGVLELCETASYSSRWV